MGKIATIGLECDCQSSEQPLDKVTKRYPTLPWFWLGSDLKFRLCFLDGGSVYDETKLQSVVLEVKEMLLSDGVLYPPDPETVPVMQKTVTSFTDISSQDDPDYDIDDGVQAVVTFTAEETDVTLTNGWFSIVGTTTDGEEVTFAAGTITPKQDGYASGISPAPAPLGNPLRFVASGAIAAGHAVNIYQDGLNFYARNATPADGYEPHGFVLVSVASGDVASVYFGGVNTACTGLSAGQVFIDTTTAGLITSTVPTGAGLNFQSVGYAVSSTACVWSVGPAIVMAE